MSDLTMMPRNNKDQKMLNAFGRKLKQLREERGLSTREFSYAADIAYSQVWTLESGKGDPTLTTLVAIAKALDLQLSELVPKD
ncbi:helix-turn-helix domain-containing protein [Terrimonas sp. NA20]|uniref:Helix-turn-helix domain-containing protein n=1 Tax=Terrimonas ginsenosidimutans TaxID=2908004 RepID=A0ABS9L045_9BACT|nr:helix-turn-helix transcriptional regulator [Terrimonas ginsenosidimutans]MCG2617945.1 helix-turn-helix domain-containing protein [Terrimonas ginsenosidimutans]